MLLPCWKSTTKLWFGSFQIYFDVRQTYEQDPVDPSMELDLELELGILRGAGWSWSLRFPKVDRAGWSWSREFRSLYYYSYYNYITIVSRWSWSLIFLKVDGAGWSWSLGLMELDGAGVGIWWVHRVLQGATLDIVLPSAKNHMWKKPSRITMTSFFKRYLKMKLEYLGKEKTVVIHISFIA